MPLATDVRLPRDHEPRLPGVCCGCLGDRAEQTLRVTGRRFTIWEVALPWLWFVRLPVRVAVPVCAPCRAAARRRGRRLRVMLVASGIPAIAVLAFVLPGPGALRGWMRLAAMAMVLAFLVPAGAWAAFHPPLVDLTVGRDHVDYEFANARYAELFRAANARRPLGLDAEDRDRLV